jgi:hypothetical protein
MTTISLPLLSRSEWGRESPPPSVPIKIPYHRPIGSKTAPGSKRSQKPAGERGHGLKKRISVSKRDHVNTFEAYSNVEGVAWLCGLLRWGKSSHQEDLQKRFQVLCHCPGLHWQGRTHSRKSCKHIGPSFIPPSLSRSKGSSVSH